MSYKRERERGGGVGVTPSSYTVHGYQVVAGHSREQGGFHRVQGAEGDHRGPPDGGEHSRSQGVVAGSILLGVVEELHTGHKADSL